MALIDLFLVRLKPELPYLTDTEARLFKQLRDGGAISFFRAERCHKCGQETYKGKQYCSMKCWESRK